MPSLPVAVSLADVLEVRGGPLRESEVWALLCQSAAAIQDFFIKGVILDKNGTIFVISPATLTVGRDGQVKFVPGEAAWEGTQFVAPEYSIDCIHSVSDTAIEKMLLFTLGQTLQAATEYGLQRNEYVGISHDLDALLEAMCEKNPAVRISMRPILEACDLNKRQHPGKPPYAQTVTRLYLTVLGCTQQRWIDNSTTSDDSCHNTLIRQSRRRVHHNYHWPSHNRHRFGIDSPQSLSPNRSRSRSRSRSPSRGTNVSNYHADFPGKTFTDRTPMVISSEKLANLSPLTAVSSPTPRTATLLSSSTINSQNHHNASSSLDFLNASFVSSADDHSSLYGTVPAYHSFASGPGLLGLRMGSPAYKKYVQLKERQRRLKAAQHGEQASTNLGVDRKPSLHLMSQPLGIVKAGLIDYSVDAYSLASLMSYSLGSYVPELHEQFSSPAAIHLTKGNDHDQSSIFSSDLSSLIQDQAPFSSAKTHHLEGEIASVAPHLKEDQEDGMSHYQEVFSQEQQNQQELSQQHLQQFTSDVEVISNFLMREFYGPEFVYRASHPMIRMSLPLQGESLKHPGHARRVIIVHLTGQKYEAIVDPSMTARQVFDALITQIALDDFYLFGLSHILDGEHFFLDLDSKLHKMAPDGWREGMKSHTSSVSFILYLRIKFYPGSLADLRHESTQHLLYLQLRRDMLEERCMATDEQHLVLCGLALQAEFGDYNQHTLGQNYFVPEQYLPARIAGRLGMAYIHNHALAAHRDALGLGLSECELQFIKVVQNLPEYGIHFYKLMKVKNDPSNLVWVGITQTSLVVAETNIPQRVIMNIFPWPSILKISFNKRRFSVQPKVESLVGVRGKVPKLNFFTNSYRKGSYLLQFSTMQHRFQIHMRNRAVLPESISIQHPPAVEGMSLPHLYMALKADNNDKECNEEEKKGMKCMGLTHQYLAPATGSHNKDCNEEEEKDIQTEHTKEQFEVNVTSDITVPEADKQYDAPPAKYRSSPPYRPITNILLDDLLLFDWSMDFQNWLSHERNVHGVGKNLTDIYDMDATAMHDDGVRNLTQNLPSFPHLSECSPVVSTHGSSNQFHLPSDEPSLSHHISEVTQQTEGFNHLLNQSTKPSIGHHISEVTQQTEDSNQRFHLPSNEPSLGRHIFEVTLHKEGDKGIGITIVGGETTTDLDLGIFIKSVMTDGPAARDGRICAGDRLIAINGTSLEGVQHNEAVKLIKESSPSVTLLISQLKSPKAIIRETGCVQNSVGTEVCISDECSVHQSDKNCYFRNETVESLCCASEFPSSIIVSSSSLSHPPPPYHHPHTSFSRSLKGGLQFRSGNESNSVDNDAKETLTFSYDTSRTKLNRDDLNSVDNDAVEKLTLSFDISRTKRNGDDSNDLAVAYSDKGPFSVGLWHDSHILDDKDENFLAEEMMLLAADVTAENDFGTSEMDSQIEYEVSEVNQEVNIHSNFGACEDDQQDIHGDFGICEDDLQDIHGDFGICENDLQDVHGDFGICKVNQELEESEVQELEVLGAIAEMTLDNSDTDSDFDSTVKAAVQGRMVKSPQIPVSGSPIATNRKRTFTDAPNVTYEVLLEKQNGSLGIIPKNMANGPMYVHTLVPGGPADKGGIIQPDKDNGEVQPHTNAGLDLMTHTDPVSNNNDSHQDIIPDEEHLKFQTSEISQDSTMVKSNHKFPTSFQVSKQLDGFLPLEEDSTTHETPTLTLPSDFVVSAMFSPVQHDVIDVVSSVSPLSLGLMDSQSSGTESEVDSDVVDVSSSHLKFQEFSVDLKKAPGKGLGFTVAGGSSTTGCCYIKAVVHDPALSDGRLQPGDMLIQANGEDLTGLSHFEAVTFLRQTPQEVSIILRRYVGVGAHNKKINPPLKTKSTGLPKTLSEYSGANIQEECHKQNHMYVNRVDEKSSESVFGFSGNSKPTLADLDPETCTSVQELIKSLDTCRAIIEPYKQTQKPNNSHQLYNNHGQKHIQSDQQEDIDGHKQFQSEQQEDQYGQRQIPSDQQEDSYGQRQIPSDQQKDSYSQRQIQSDQQEDSHSEQEELLEVSLVPILATSSFERISTHSATQLAWKIC